MHESLSWGGWMLVVAAGAASPASTVPSAPAEREPHVAVPAVPSAVLDERWADVHEDEDPARIIASLHGVLTLEGDGARLRLAASAVGPRVMPPPGAEHVGGGNLITAEELAGILEQGRAEVRVLRHGERVASGTTQAGRTGIVEQRRLSPHAGLRHVAAMGGPMLVEGLFEAQLPGSGQFEVEMHVDGRLRARATCRVRGGRGAITRLEGVAAHGASEARP